MGCYSSTGIAPTTTTAHEKAPPLNTVSVPVSAARARA
jgi:hypothetical protein